MLSLFPRDVLDEIWNLIESVSEGFLHTLSFQRCFSLACQLGNENRASSAFEITDIFTVSTLLRVAIYGFFNAYLL